MSASAVSFKVHAETAEEAARKVYCDEDFENRGLPMPKICKCAALVGGKP